MRKKRSLLERFFRKLSALILIPFIFYTILDTAGIDLAFAKGLVDKKTIVIENIVAEVEETVEEVREAQGEDAHDEEVSNVPEDDLVIEEQKETTEVAEEDTEKIAMDGDTILHKRMRSEPQRKVQRTIKRIAGKHNVDWKMAYAICFQETGCNPEIDCSRQYGLCDNGESFGAWQINKPWKKNIAIEQALDFEWATEWSILRLKRHESLGQYEQIRSHNGLYDDYRNDAYVKDVQHLMSVM
jgi:hypothetical protein